MPANQINYLSRSGMKAFRDDTSRWYASRNNELLVKVDEALDTYLSKMNDSSTVKAACLDNLLITTQKWLDSKRDKVISQHHSFRLPVVAALKDQAASEKHKVSLHQFREIAGANERAQLQRNLQQKAEQQQQIRQAANMDRFRSAVHTVGQLATNGVTDRLISKRIPGLKPSELGAIGLKVKMLDAPKFGVNYGDNYWLEAADPKHRMGQTLMKHRDKFAKSDKRSMAEYADSLEGEDMKELEKNQVCYLEDLVVRTLFEVDFQGGKLTSKMTPELQSKVIAKQEKEPAKKKEARQALFADANQAELNTSSWPSKGWQRYGDGWACFVMSAYGTTYVGVHQGGTFHHSSFLCGAPVLAAGMIKVVDGVPVAVSEKNGHTKCDEDNMKQFVFLLRERLPGVDWSKVDYYNSAGSSRSAQSKINEWMGKVDPKSVVDAIERQPGKKVLTPEQAQQAQAAQPAQVAAPASQAPGNIAPSRSRSMSAPPVMMQEKETNYNNE